jgi:hypothetical protein
MSNFGALTDHFGILALPATGGGTLGDSLKLVDSSNVPVTKNREDANDENGDIAASTYFGDASETLSEASCTYALCSGALDTEDLALGELSTGVIAITAEITTSNDAWPQLTVTGTLGPTALDTSIDQTFTLPDFDINGRKQAQEIGFTTTAGCKLTGSSLSCSIDLSSQEDGLGEPCAHGVSGGTVEVTGDFVRVTASPAWTVTDVDLTETKAPGENEGQASYHTGTGTAAGTLIRDTTP